MQCNQFFLTLLGITFYSATSTFLFFQSDFKMILNNLGTWVRIFLEELFTFIGILLGVSCGLHSKCRQVVIICTFSKDVLEMVFNGSVR